VTRLTTISPLRYPWTKWFNRGRFRLLRGRDYRCKTHGMAAQIRNYAAKKGISVSVRIDDNGIEARIMGPRKRRPRWRHACA